MAVTNEGKTTLVNKLKSLGHILRLKATPYKETLDSNATGNLKTPPVYNGNTYTLEQMVEQIQLGYHNYVKDIYYMGSFNEVDASWGILHSYTPDGRLVLTAKSYTGSGEYEHIVWTLYGTPEGSNITLERGDKPDLTLPKGMRGQLISCIISGITQDCRIVLEQGEVSTNHDYTEIRVWVEYFN